jgi:hypothetical protein
MATAAQATNLIFIMLVLHNIGPARPEERNELARFMSALETGRPRLPRQQSHNELFGTLF